MECDPICAKDIYVCMCVCSINAVHTKFWIRHTKNFTSGHLPGEGHFTSYFTLFEFLNVIKFFFLTIGVAGWLIWLSVQLLVLAQVMISVL